MFLQVVLATCLKITSDLEWIFWFLFFFQVAREPAAGSGKKCLKSRQPVPEGSLNGTGKRLNFDPEQWKLNLENFRRKKQHQNIVRIRTHAHSFDGPVQLPLGHRHIAAEFCLNHFFIIQLTLTSLTLT